MGGEAGPYYWTPVQRAIMSVPFLRHLWGWRSFLILLLTPLILLPIPVIIEGPEAKCAFVVLLMAVYWVTESLPVAITSLMPVLLFPTLGIADTGTIAGKYMNDVNMLFISGLMMAVAIEYWNLHRRIALRVLMLVGAEPRWLMLGMMLATWFLSMWISNTATTAMMVPITDAILQQLKRTKSNRNENGADAKNHAGNDIRAGDIELQVKASDEDETPSKGENQSKDEESNPGIEDYQTRVEAERFERLGKGMSLCICYAANSGGIASLTGTGPNLVLKGAADELFDRFHLRSPVTFGSWMGFGLPLSAVILVVCWCWLQVAFLRCRGGCGCCGPKQDEEQKKRVKAVIDEEYEKLGPMVFGQGLILLLFVLLVVLWITRDLGGVIGWGHLFTKEVEDSVPAVFVAILLFSLPSTLPCLPTYKNYFHPEIEAGKKIGEQREIYGGPVVIRPLLNWQMVHQKMPWSLFLLLGGGFALSHGCKVSGLSAWIGTQLSVFSEWNHWVMLLAICYITAMATEVTSNTAISQLFLPIMAQLALDTHTHPLYYMFPVALSCSFAFMLPVATPPNAIVFAYGRIKIVDMMLAGVVMNILAVPILVAVTGTVGNAIFRFDDIPAEFLNQTIIETVEVVSA